jgi:hypothetical protein
MRAAGPVIEVHLPIVGKVWTTTRQDLSDQVLRDSGSFTVRKEDGTIAGLRWWMPAIFRTLSNSMLAVDDPDHRRLRNIVDEAFRRRAVSAMEEMFFPSMTQAPRIVPVTPWPRVPLMNPVRRTWATKLPSALNDTASASFPTWPLQFPTIAFGYSPSDTGLPSCEHEESSHASSKPNKSERTIVIIDVMIADFLTHMPQLKRARQRLSTASKFKLGHHRTDSVGDRVHSAAGNFRPLPRPLNKT